MSARMLIVEDEPAIAEVLEYLLAADGHSIRRAADGTEGWRLYREWGPDLVLLDLGLPGLPGFDLLRCVRGHREDQPVIILTARGESESRVRGLEGGADDYIVKPFVNEEVRARVRAVLRRCPPRSRTLSFGSIRLTPEAYLLQIGEERLVLSRNECALLEDLMRQPGRVRTRARLVEAMYDPGEEVSDRAVDQAVRRLRAKILPLLGGWDPIVAEYGIGYRLEGGGEAP